MAADDPSRGFGFLAHDIARLFRREFDRRARALGLTRAQWSVIAHLRRHEGIHQAALAELVEIAPITLARLLDRMAAAGWIERRPDPADRRARRLFLTERARAEFKPMREIAAEVRATALAGLAPDEVTQLMATLERVKANLATADDGAMPRGGRPRVEAARAPTEPASSGRNGRQSDGRRGRAPADVHPGERAQGGDPGHLIRPRRRVRGL